MKGLQYAIDLVDRTFGTTISKSKANTKGLDDAVGKANKNIARIGKTGQQSFGNIATYAKRAAAAVGLVFALNSAVAFGQEVENIGAKFQGFENAIRFASGNEGAKNLAFLNAQVDNLDLNMEAAYQGFQTLSGSMIGTKLAGQGVRDIFEGVAIAGRVMNLTGEQAQGTYLALSQIASKGVVSMEELRQQLSERIPGALKIAADAMGLPLDEFNKLVEAGKLSAEVFLPRFAKAMKERFAGGVAEALDSLQASRDRAANAFTQMQRDIATNMEGSFKAFNEFKANFFSGISELLPKLEPLKVSIQNLFKAFEPLTDALGRVGGAFGGAEGMINGLARAIDYIAVPIEILAMGLGTIIDFLNPILPLLGAVAAGWWAINVAMYANPIGLVIAAIVALVGIVTYAWQRVGWFRGSILAAWEAIKGFAKSIKEAVIVRFQELLAGISGVAKAIKFVFQGEWKKAFESAKEARDNLFSMKSAKVFVDESKKAGVNMVKAYQKGVAEAEANSSKPSALDRLTKGLAPGNANNKLLPGGATPDGNIGGGGSGGGGTAPASVVGGGGTTNKHTTFNIQSMVQNLTISTTNLTGDPADVKAKLERIFLELMGDLELRASS